MIPTDFLPTLNALLNGLSAVLLTLGFLYIRRGRVHAHRALMIAAFLTSAAFLASYLLYHARAGSRPFTGQGWIRAVYFAVLIPHVLLAFALLPLALATLYRGWRGPVERHRRIARWTLPIWGFISVTGIAVYWMLYRL
jgi:putative membrane protein